MPGLIGKKVGMTSIYGVDGKNIPCTVIQVGPCVVTQVRTTEKDGYDALQLGFEEKREKRETKAMLGHFTKAKTTPKKILAEFGGFNKEYKLGDTVSLDIFPEDSWVDVIGTSKGKGFQGVVKRYNFKGVNEGQSWCLSGVRFAQSILDNQAPQIFIHSTHKDILSLIDLKTLKKYAIDL